MHWFSLNNGAELTDLDFLKNLGIHQEPPRGETLYLRDQNTGRMMQFLGMVFVKTDGRVQFRPRHDTPAAGIRVLVRTAVDCLEHDLHKTAGWLYKRKTSKRPGYWATAVYVAVDPAGEVSQDVTVLRTAVEDLSAPLELGITRDELQPAGGDVQ